MCFLYICVGSGTWGSSGLRRQNAVGWGGAAPGSSGSSGSSGSRLHPCPTSLCSAPCGPNSCCPVRQSAPVLWPRGPDAGVTCALCCHRGPRRGGLPCTWVGGRSTSFGLRASFRKGCCGSGGLMPVLFPGLAGRAGEDLVPLMSTWFTCAHVPLLQDR